jgi:hypothetical protein
MHDHSDDGKATGDSAAVWRFATANFTIEHRIHDCLDEPNFDDPELSKAINGGQVPWFDNEVVVLCGKVEIGHSWSCCCTGQPADYRRGLVEMRWPRRVRYSSRSPG